MNNWLASFVVSAEWQIAALAFIAIFMIFCLIGHQRLFCPWGVWQIRHCGS
jgi:hypothetical protein